jgi:hypothetical protein
MRRGALDKLLVWPQKRPPMSSEADKAQVEFRVFAEFIALARLPIRMESVKKRLPPEPDLLCCHEREGKVAFELVELCDSNLARALSDPRPSAGGVEYVRTSDPSWAIVLKKLRTKYDTNYPIELLCYTNGRIITPSNVIRPTLETLLGSYRHTFCKAWLMSKGEIFSLWD